MAKFCILFWTAKELCQYILLILWMNVCAGIDGPVDALVKMTDLITQQ